MTDDIEDVLWRDRKVAEYLNKHPKTIKRWDKTPAMKALGWPARVDVNGHGHRQASEVRAFVKNAAAAVTSKL
jgi:hypothetical protein